MIRGTTPTVALVLPDYVDFTGTSAAYLSFGQNGVDKFDIGIANLTFDGSKVTATLTQTQTLMLEAGRLTQIQLRWKNNGVAYATYIVQIETAAIIKEGEI